MLADDLILGQPGCLKQMVDAHRETGGNVVAVEEVPRDQTDKYGVLDIAEDDGKLARAKGLVEKPKPADAPSTLSIIGRYILSPIVLTVLDHQGSGAGGEIQLTDAMAKTIDLVPFHGYRFEGRRFDCGSKVGYLEANIAYALDRPDMREGIRDVLDRYRATGASNAAA